MQRLFKVIFVNIFSIIILLCTVEVIFTVSNYNSEKIDKELNYKKSNIKKKYTFSEYIMEQKIKFEPEADYILDYEFRKPALPKETNKKGILLLGCSFTYGQFLDNKDAFHSILSKQTNRSVYNLGISGGSPRETLFLLRNRKDLKNIIPNKDIKYVIYTYIPDQERRLYTDIREIVPSFRLKNKGKALEYYTHNKFIHASNIYRNFSNLYYEYLVGEEESFALFSLYLSEISKEVKNIYGKDIEFIVFIYPDYDPDNKYKWQKINKNEITILNITKKLDIENNSNAYKIKDDDHPNAKAWQVIVPALVKELDL